MTPTTVIRDQSVPSKIARAGRKTEEDENMSY